MAGCPAGPAKVEVIMMEVIEVIKSLIDILRELIVTDQMIDT